MTPAGAAVGDGDDLPLGEAQNLDLVWRLPGFSGTEVRPVVEDGRLVAYVSAADAGLLKLNLQNLDRPPTELARYTSPTGLQLDRLVSLNSTVAGLSWQTTVGIGGDNGGGFELVSRDGLTPFTPPVRSGGGCHDITLFEAKVHGRNEQVLACMAQAMSPPSLDFGVDFWVITDPVRPYHAVRWADDQELPGVEGTHACDTAYMQLQAQLQQRPIHCFEVFPEPPFRPHWFTPLTGHRFLQSGYDHLAVVEAADLGRQPTVRLQENMTEDFGINHAHEAHLRRGTLAVVDEAPDTANGQLVAFDYTHTGLALRGRYWPPGSEHTESGHYGEFVPLRSVSGIPSGLNSRWFVSSWYGDGITIADLSLAPDDQDGIAEANRPTQRTTWGNTIAWARTGGSAVNVAPIVVDEQLYILVADQHLGLLLYRYCPAC